MERAVNRPQSVDTSIDKYAKLYADFAATNSEQIISNADAIWTNCAGKVDALASQREPIYTERLAGRAAEEYYDYLVAHGVYDHSDFTLEDREAFRNYVVGATKNVFEANLSAYKDNTVIDVNNNVVYDDNGSPRKIVEGFEKDAVPYDVYASGGVSGGREN